MEGVCGSVGDCWKGLRVGRTPKCFWNWEAVGVRGTDVFMCLNEFMMCQRVAKVIGSFCTLSDPIPHLGTPVVQSFGFQPYGVAMPEAQGYS